MRTTSHLTRQVFRALTAERPYYVPGCLQQSQCSTPRPPRTLHRPLNKRSIFGLSIRATKESFEGAKATPQNLEAALSKLIDVLRAQRSRTRAPANNEVIDAFKFLFQVRAELPKGLTRNEIYIATEAFEFLRRRKLVLNSDGSTGLSADDLQNVLIALARAGNAQALQNESKVLATAVFGALRSSLDSTDTEAKVHISGPQAANSPLSTTYITTLARTGSATEALGLLQELEHTGDEVTPLWSAVLLGLLREGRTSAFWTALEDVQRRLGPLDADTHAELVTFFSRSDDIVNATRIFDVRLRDGHVPSTQSLISMLSMCVRMKEDALGGKFADALRARSDLGDSAGVLIMWYASRDSNPEALRTRLMELSENGMTDVITMKTFNRLITLALSKNDPALAQRYLQLAESFGLFPDATTYALQLEYEVMRGDLAAASRHFEAMTLEDVPEDRFDVPALNRLLTSLCFSPQPNYELVMRVVDRVLETGADLEAETLAGLCSVFLKRDDLEEAVGLLRYRVDAFPRAERARIAAVFKAFICDPDVKDQRAYNAYDLFRTAFPETDPIERVPIMQSFFARNRPDLACLVFGHMRQREDPEGRPTAEIYAECFYGIAKCRDVDGLTLVHNMLRLDLEVEPNIRIHNSLMAACNACRMPFSSIIDHFWKILDSREGPTLSSFVLALRACETWVPQGSVEARKIMALMQKWNMVITKELYDAYIGAIAGQSQFENTVELIEHMHNDIGEHPDATTIGTFYNAIPWQYRKDEVEKWARAAYPELWDELITYGEVIDEEWEVRYFKINRDVDINDELLFGQGQYNPQLAHQPVPRLEQPSK